MRYAAMDNALGRGERPVEAVFPAARAAGLDGVEVRLGANYESDALWSLAGARAARANAQSLGLDLPSLALIVLNSGGFATPDQTVRASARDIVRHGIDVAVALGARTILVPFFGAGKIVDAAGVAQVAEDLRAAAPAAEAAGVVLGLETTLPAPALLDLLRQIDSPAVRGYFDVANAVWLGYDAVQELTTLSAAGALSQVHVKDIAELPGDRPPGEGRVPYPDVATTLDEIGYDGYLVFETRPTEDPVAAARRHRIFMQGLLRKSSA